MTVGFFVSATALAIWIYLLGFRGGYWRARESDESGLPAAPSRWPSVAAIVPARNEADVIRQSLGSLLRQDYEGEFRIHLVDDQSVDDTAEAARAADIGGRVTVIRGAEPPSGWTGKLWALKQGIQSASGSPPDYYWLTDADIVHSRDNLRRLVTRAEGCNCVLVSLMAKLRCESFAERFLIPAFVYFFALLYPFSWVNRRGDSTAAAAGGCILVRRGALEAAGGVEAIRHQIIDDCALARRLKMQGSIWLGFTERTISLRPYGLVRDIGNMVARSAFAQLRYSPLLLTATIAGMILTYAVPPVLAIFSSGPTRIASGAAWLCMAISFQPILRFYRRSAFWGLALPLIGIVYAAFTLDSAIRFWRGRGGVWKGRIQAMTRA